jgi:hypothetical protein
MKHLTMCTSLALLGLLCRPATAEPKQQDLVQFRQTFHYHKGLPHPLLIRQLTPWISDSVPTTVMVDVASAQDSNQYFADDQVKYNANGAVFTSSEANALHYPKAYRYQFLGHLDKGTLVLEIEEQTGGSMIARSLLFLDASLGQSLTAEGKPYAQLLLRVRREYVLGDRAECVSKIDHNQVRVTYKDGRKVVIPAP